MLFHLHTVVHTDRHTLCRYKSGHPSAIKIWFRGNEAAQQCNVLCVTTCDKNGHPNHTRTNERTRARAHTRARTHTLAYMHARHRDTRPIKSDTVLIHITAAWLSSLNAMCSLQSSQFCRYEENTNMAISLPDLSTETTAVPFLCAWSRFLS